MKRLILVSIALLILGTAGLAQKGGGKPPKPGPPADPAIAYLGGNDLYVMNADGSNQTRVYRTVTGMGVQIPSWSPDGHSIVFTECCSYTRVIDISVVNGVPQAVGTRNLLENNPVCGICAFPEWSPDGNEIVVTGGPNTGLYIVPAGGGALETLYLSPAGHKARTPTWSPDGSEIAFVEHASDLSGPQYVKVLDRATGQVTSIPLTLGSEYFIRSVEWSRGNRNSLVYQIELAAGGMPATVYTLDLPFGSPSYVVEGSWPTWSPDDGRIAFSASPGKVKVIDLSTGTISVLANGVAPHWRVF